MKRVGMLFRGVVCGVAILSLLFIFSVPAAHSQVGADCIGVIQIKGKLKVFDTDSIDNEKGGTKGPAILRSIGISALGGFVYEINVLDDTGAGNLCGEITVGQLSTIGSDEATADGNYTVDGNEFPDDFEPDTILTGFFNAIVSVNKDDELKKFRSKGITATLFDLAGVLGYGKNTNIKFTKKKDFDAVAKKFKLECDDPT